MSALAVIECRDILGFSDAKVVVVAIVGLLILMTLARRPGSTAGGGEEVRFAGVP